MKYFNILCCFILCFVLSSSSCVNYKNNNTSLRNNAQELVVNSNTWFFLWKGKDTLQTPNYFLYCDSFLLEKKYVYYTNSSSNGYDTSYFKLKHYRFEDLRNKVAYFYTQFTPDAKLWGKLPTNVSLDSLTEVHSGYFLVGRLDNFYLNKMSYTSICDTVVENKTYKRIDLTYFYKTDKIYNRFWAIKNDTLAPFTMIPKLTKETGLAFVNCEAFESKEFKKSFGKNGISINRTSFTQEERNVFNAWRNNCEKYKSRKMGIDKKANL